MLHVPFCSWWEGQAVVGSGTCGLLHPPPGAGPSQRDRGERADRGRRCGARPARTPLAALAPPLSARTPHPLRHPCQRVTLCADPGRPRRRRGAGPAPRAQPARLAGPQPGHGPAHRPQRHHHPPGELRRACGSTISRRQPQIASRMPSRVRCRGWFSSRRVGLRRLGMWRAARMRPAALERARKDLRCVPRLAAGPLYERLRERVLHGRHGRRHASGQHPAASLRMPGRCAATVRRPTLPSPPPRAASACRPHAAARACTRRPRTRGLRARVRAAQGTWLWTVGPFGASGMSLNVAKRGALYVVSGAAPHPSNRA
jgi:hypothetical protein